MFGLGRSSGSKPSGAPPPPQRDDSAIFDQLLTLARDNDFEGIKALLSVGCPPSFSNRMGQTALHIGAMWGSIEAVQALLQGAADPNQANKMRGSTPMHAAAMGRGPVDRRAECVKLMIKYKGNPNKPDNTGELPIESAGDEILRLAFGAKPLFVHKAVEAKNLQSLKDAIKQILTGKGDGIALDTTNPDGNSALHLAASIPWWQGTEVLLATKADASLQNNSQRTPLHTSLLSGDRRNVEMLIAAKSDVNIQDRDVEHDPRFSSTTFKENPYCHRTPMHYAAQLGNVLAARLLVQAKADVNRPDSKRQTPLHLCLALREDEAVIESGSGVRVNGLKSRPEWNGLMGVVCGQPVKDAQGVERFPVQVESDVAADASLLKSDNLTPLSDEILDLLLEASADVNLGNQAMGEERTVLHEAARTGDASLAQKVLSAGVRVNQQDSKLGLSALHVAARGKHHDVIKLIVEAKADKTQMNKDGKTALQLAKTNRANEAIVALLDDSSLGESKEEVNASKPQSLSELTAEQRALLFID